MLCVALSKEEHLLYTKIWREMLPYGNRYSSFKVLTTSVKVYWDKPKLLVSVLKTILFKK